MVEKRKFEDFAENIARKRIQRAADGWTYHEGQRAQQQNPDPEAAPPENFRRGIYFGGGCDCSFNPNTCGAGWACRWQH